MSHCCVFFRERDQLPIVKTNVCSYNEREMELRKLVGAMNPVFDYQHAPRRVILAVDIKSYFASVECAIRGLDPFKTNLVVVSDLQQKGGVILAATPAMKKNYGINTTNRLFEVPNDPSVKIVEPHMQMYIDMNMKIQQLFYHYTEKKFVHVYSIDEAFLDVTGSVRLYGGLANLVQALQQEMYKQFRLYCTIGIGDNPLLAKLAMDNEAKHRESGIAYWNYENIPEKIWQIKRLTDFWGIGRRTALRLEKLGIYTIKSLAHASLTALKKEFGIIGEQLFYHANGLDYTRLDQAIQTLEKSYGGNQILMRDYHLQAEVEVVIAEMVDNVAERLRNHSAVGDFIRLSIGNSAHSTIKGFSRQMKLHTATNLTWQFQEAFLRLFRKYYEGDAVRSIGISIGGVTPESYHQLNLFASPEILEEKRRLDFTIDQIRGRYGKQAIMRAVSYTASGNGIIRNGKVGGHKK